MLLVLVVVVVMVVVVVLVIVDPETTKVRGSDRLGALEVKAFRETGLPGPGYSAKSGNNADGSGAEVWGEYYASVYLTQESRASVCRSRRTNGGKTRYTNPPSPDEKDVHCSLALAGHREPVVDKPCLWSR
jgi:hypothetical protein